MNEQIKLMPQDYLIRFLLPIIPKKLKPNHLTLIRLIGAPLQIIWLAQGEFAIGFWLFVVLALTDLLDGAIARLRDEITDWGKVWDPVADKLLVGIVVFMLLMKVNVHLAVLVLSVEGLFILASVYVKFKVENFDVQANIWGKIKMFLQSFGGAGLLIGFWMRNAEILQTAELFFYGAMVFAVISLVKKGI